MKFMELAGNVFQRRKKLVKFYCLIVLLGTFMIIARKMSDFTGGYSFLLWNFLLAMIPLILSSFLVEMGKHGYRNSTMLIPGFFWLLFLPNALYMLSDYKYVWNDSSDNINLNILSLSWYIIPALLAAVISLNDVSNILVSRYGRKIANAAVIAICILTGFGVFIGCYLRFNSWDLIHKPLNVFSEIARIIIHPRSNANPLVISPAYGMVLYLTFRVVKAVSREFTDTGK